MYSIKKLDLGEALPLLVLTPGIVAIFAFIFLGEVLSLFEIIGLLLLLTGVYIHGINKKQRILDPFKRFLFSKGHGYIILALLIFSFTSLLDKVILVNLKLSPEPFMAFQHLFFAIIFVTIFFFFKDEKFYLKRSIKNSWFPILLISLFTISYRYTSILAISSSSSVALAIAIKRVSVFFAVLIGGKIFQEKKLLRRVIATFFLVLGSILVI